MFLAALPIVQKIVRRKILSTLQADAYDVVQSIVLRLWKWRDKYPDKSEEMSFADWQSFAARATYNEINRYFTNAAGVRELPLDAAANVADQKSTVGEANAEIRSLIQPFWQEICSLSLRQRRALLLHSRELVIYLLKYGIEDECLAQVLDFTIDEWAAVKERLPLSDMDIAGLTRADNAKSIELKAKSIKKARYEARHKMRRLTSQ